MKPSIQDHIDAITQEISFLEASPAKLALIRERNRLLARQRASAARKAQHEALTSLGLKRVRGALGGTYYE